jgi:hypothetical protein
LKGLPSGALRPRYFDRSGHWRANASPTGYGWVAQVFAHLFCGTLRSTMPTSGVPFVRSSRYSQPVLQASPTPFRFTPLISTSKMKTGEGQS